MIPLFTFLNIKDRLQEATRGYQFWELIWEWTAVSFSFFERIEDSEETQVEILRNIFVKKKHLAMHGHQFLDAGNEINNDIEWLFLSNYAVVETELME